MLEHNIQMVDLRKQYQLFKGEIDSAIQTVTESGLYINGPQVKSFEKNLEAYLNVPHVISCGNGTDALQIALMALELRPGDEVIVPAFTYVAAVEVICLLGMKPVLVDVDPNTFNINVAQIESVISQHTKAIIAVHLFGQSCDMEALLKICKKYKIFLIEDNAQSIGAEYTFSDGTVKKAGTIGHIGTTSFFPTKPLACMGDGGALMTSDAILAERCRMISMHGQKKKYFHEIIGFNSRLDTVQAAILDVKLKYLKGFTAARIRIAERYDEKFFRLNEVVAPTKSFFSSHVYHQYTIKVSPDKREGLRAFLKERGIQSMIYYPLPIYQQAAFKWNASVLINIENASILCNSVLSLPIYPEMTDEEQDYIFDAIQEWLTTF